MSLEDQNRRNAGWYYFKTLKAISESGHWPQGLTTCDRKTLRNNGLIIIEYIPQKGKKPTLTQLAQELLKNTSVNNTKIRNITKEI